MRALSSKGQEQINNSKMQISFNLKNSINLIGESLGAINMQNIPMAIEGVCRSCELMVEASRDSFIVGEGLIPLVMNEVSDAENHRCLSKINKLLFSIYSDFFRLDAARYFGENVINYRTFQLRGIMKRLLYVVCTLIHYEKISLN